MRAAMISCEAEGCDRSHYAKGFCQKHYRRWRRHGDPLAFYPDATRTCTVEACDRPHEAKGLCHAHRSQSLRGSSLGPIKALASGTLAERFEFYISRGETCWEWTGAVSSTGYGHLHFEGRMHGAHRVAYELFKGPIPQGLVIDHLCRNRRCANPDHLEPVTPEENTRRGFDSRALHA